jgi:hypothetical protein
MKSFNWAHSVHTYINGERKLVFEKIDNILAQKNYKSPKVIHNKDPTHPGGVVYVMVSSPLRANPS